MEKNLLHSGIDKKQLAEKFEEFMQIEFPNEPEEDDYYDLFSELVELDGHIAGLITSYLKNMDINFALLDADDAFNNLLSELSTETQPVKDMVDYKKHLDALIIMIKTIEGIAS